MNRRSFMTCVLVFVLTTTFGSAPAADAPDAQPTLRYRLTPGIHLVYETVSKTTGDNAQSSNSTAEIWVLAANADGGWHLFAKSSANTESFDLAPDGTVSNPISGMRMTLSTFFPSLPADLKAHEWTSTDIFGEMTRFSLDGVPQGGVQHITAVQESDMNKIYLMKKSRNISFDAQRGYITGSTSKGEEGYGTKSQFSDEMKLKSADGLVGHALADFVADDTVYHAAMKSYTDLMMTAEQDPAVFKPAGQLLKDAKPKLKTAMFQKLMDSSLKSFTMETEQLSSSARDLTAMKDKPAPSWELRDLTGKTVRLADLKGKIVILDFWYRGCGWCIRAMPQIRQIADDFKDKPLAVFGMNTDRDVTDAQFTSDTMKLNYPTLLLGQDRKVVDAMKVRGFPTLFIIDQQGIVRDIHVGWSPTLKQDVEASIRRLLNSEGTAKTE